MPVIQKKVCLLGDFSVGKSSLIRRYVEGRFDEKYLSTIGVNISRKSLERGSHTLNMILWDLAGGEGSPDFQPVYLRGSAGAMLICDLTRRSTLDSISRYVEILRSVNPSTGFVLVANKNDLAGQFQFNQQDLQEISEVYQCPFVTASAKSGDQVEAAFTLLAARLEAQK